MRKAVLTLLLIACCNALAAQESTPVPKREAKRGDVAGYTSRDATVLSMMGWGVALAVGIATLCALIDRNATSSSSHSH